VINAQVLFLRMHPKIEMVQFGLGNYLSEHPFFKF